MAIPLQLTQEEAAVVVCARTEQSTDDSPGSIGETAEAIRAARGRALAVKPDVPSDAEIEAAVERTSADGRFVTFGSDASNLVPGDSSLLSDVFVHDRRTHRTERVSIDSTGSQGNGISAAAAISTHGHYVVFYSEASNLVDRDASGFSDIFVHDRRPNSDPDGIVGGNDY